MIQISVINESIAVSDADVATAVAALQVQVSRDFAPVWGIDAALTFVPKGQTPAAGSWWLVILDNSDQAGALGYHDLTDQGFPIGKVFAGTTIQYGGVWTVTASHELLEMLGDPDVNLTVFVEQGEHSGMLFVYEVADACEDDQFGYAINGVTVSDFVFPSWFETFQSGVQFDFQNQIQAPLQLLSGGYIGVYDVRKGSGWQQITAQIAKLSPLVGGGTANEAPSYQHRARVGSRRERRRTPRAEWLRSKR